MDRNFWYFMCFSLGTLVACHQDSRERAEEKMTCEDTSVIGMFMPGYLKEALIEEHSPDTGGLHTVLCEQQKTYKDMGLEDVQKHIPQVLVDLKYSTSDNFLGRDVYGDLTTAYLQKDAIVKLKTAFDLLQEELPGHRFIIYDAARPLSVQQTMWDSIDVPEHQKFWYVAPPDRGSLHNYGMAVDLTITDSLGKPLDMGTPFDYFGKKAYPRYTQKFLEKGKLSQMQANNRELLIRIMHQAGFSVARTEWWHFNATSLKHAKKTYPVIP